MRTRENGGFTVNTPQAAISWERFLQALRIILSTYSHLHNALKHGMLTVPGYAASAAAAARFSISRASLSNSRIP